MNHLDEATCSTERIIKNGENQLKIKTLPKTASALWNRDSSVLLGGVLLTMLTVAYFWWPLLETVLKRMNRDGLWWLHSDWLLIGIFAFMTVTIILRADLKRDALIVLTATVGGLVIEAWGTQTNLWHYYTAERPPLWIIPAWPIATLSIDRIARFLDHICKKTKTPKWLFKAAHWMIFALFMLLMGAFVAPTTDKYFTLFALLICIAVIITPKNQKQTVLIFIAGATLGYFLELWGTTRRCWTYYTLETPPLFAVMAHGMAAIAFWRAELVLKTIAGFLKSLLNRPSFR